MNIASLAAQRADSLSGGQRQSVARALVQEPEIVLADEPIASLDPRNSRIVMASLLRINRHYGITVLATCIHSRSRAHIAIGWSEWRAVGWYSTARRAN